MDFKPLFPHTSVPLLWLVETEHQSSWSAILASKRPTGEERSSSVPLGLDRASEVASTEHLVSFSVH